MKLTFRGHTETFDTFSWFWILKLEPSSSSSSDETSFETGDERFLLKWYSDDKTKLEHFREMFNGYLILPGTVIVFFVKKYW